MAEHPGPRGAWDHLRLRAGAGPGELPGCAGERGASRLLGLRAAAGSFSESVFPGKWVWEMRFYPSPCLPEESERPSIIHCQAGCLGSQRARTRRGVRRSPLLPLHCLPCQRCRRARSGCSRGRPRERLLPGGRAGGSADSLAVRGCPLAARDRGVPTQRSWGTRVPRLRLPCHGGPGSGDPRAWKTRLAGRELSGGFLS